MLTSSAQQRRPATAKPPQANALSLGSIFLNRPTETITAGSALFWEGDDADRVFELIDGVLRIFKFIGDGRRAITGFLYPGDIVGVSIREKHLYSAEAVNAVKVSHFAKSSFYEAIDKSPELRPLLFAKLCDEMAAAHDQMVLLARKNAEERICSFLISLATRFSLGGNVALRIQVPMTRLDIGDYLGLTLETVSRTLSQLISRGIIGQLNRHEIAVKKMGALLSLAGNCDKDDVSKGIMDSTARQFGQLETRKSRKSIVNLTVTRASMTPAELVGHDRAFFTQRFHRGRT